MALLDWHYFSTVLDKNYSFRVLTPDTYEGPQKVVYLLHGLSDDYTNWTRMTRLESYWEAKFSKNVTIVMPDGERSFYSDAKDGHGGNYDSFISQELAAYVERHLPFEVTRENRMICGLSMGGYGALRFALKYPQMFSAAGSFSGAVNIERFAKMEELSARLRHVGPGPNPNSLEYLLENVPNGLMPRIRMVCGFDDFLLEDNRGFHAFLQEKGVSHEYEEFPGNHNWLFWDTHISAMLEFLTK